MTLRVRPYCNRKKNPVNSVIRGTLLPYSSMF